MKPITAIAVLLLVVVSLLVAGCTSSTNSNQAPSSASPETASSATTTANATANATSSASATPSASASAISPTPTSIPTPTPPTPTPTPTPKVATKLSVWRGSMGEPAEWLLPKSDPNWQPVNQTEGSGAYVHYIIFAADGTSPCGVANYYIDGQPAGGVWWVNNGTDPNRVVPGCGSGMAGGAGGLTLQRGDIDKLSLGQHTLTIDYLGDWKYAPSSYIAAFWVVR